MTWGRPPAKRRICIGGMNSDAIERKGLNHGYSAAAAQHRSPSIFFSEDRDEDAHGDWHTKTPKARPIVGGRSSGTTR